MGRFRIVRTLVWVVLIGMLGLTSFAILSELPAPTREVSVPLGLPEEDT